MDASQNSLTELITRLAATPARFANHTAGWSHEQLQARSTAESWSVHDILAHVRAADEIVTPRIYMVLARDNPMLVAYDERRWAEIAGYADQDFATSLTLFMLRRAAVVTMLKMLDVQAWQRTGIHETQGTLSLLEIAQGLIEHEEEHCAQLEALSQPLPS